MNDGSALFPIIIFILSMGCWMNYSCGTDRGREDVCERLPASQQAEIDICPKFVEKKECE